MSNTIWTFALKLGSNYIVWCKIQWQHFLNFQINATSVYSLQASIVGAHAQRWDGHHGDHSQSKN